jgi:hypothetical protein
MQVAAESAVVPSDGFGRFKQAQSLYSPEVTATLNRALGSTQRGKLGVNCGILQGIDGHRGLVEGYPRQRGKCS